MQILSWNINAVRTKLEKQQVYNLIKSYDIISLNEIRTPLKVSCPGYISIICITSHDSANPHRGGTCGLIKNQLVSQVTSVDVTKPDQVWLQLRCYPGTLFEFCLYPT